MCNAASASTLYDDRNHEAGLRCRPTRGSDGPCSATPSVLREHVVEMTARQFYVTVHIRHIHD